MDFYQNDNSLPSSPYKAYLLESRKPIVCLVFALPFFLCYHIGVWWMGKVSLDGGKWLNGADKMLADALNYLGIGGPLISFFFVLVVFIFLQQISNRGWQVRPGTLALMMLESAIFALPPFLLNQVVTRVIDPTLAAAVGTVQSDDQMVNYLMNLILSVGAGVYEEFLFRMVLMTALFAFFKNVFKMKGAPLYIVAVLGQALLFALLHHLPTGPDPLSWELVKTIRFMRTFAFRILAGVYFAYLYQERGFGIAAGAHAFYDIAAVTLIMFSGGQVI
ncbi:MAG: CPBP family intramembrane metalloprotease [Planctomycetes bacterium]|nr:CPBP family intramembrane metalloprotease [Planctomycetota bacterium]